MSATLPRTVNYGEKRVRFRRNGSEAVNSITFQVTGVSKLLSSVSRILDKGNTVVFSRSGDGSYIRNEATAEKVPIIEDKGTFVTANCWTLHPEQWKRTAAVEEGIRNLRTAVVPVRLPICVIPYLLLDYKLPTVSTVWHTEEVQWYLEWENFKDQTKFQFVTYEQITVEPKICNCPVKSQMERTDHLHISNTGWSRDCDIRFLKVCSC